VPVPFARLSEQKDGESSAVIRARVVAARAIQTKRFAGVVKWVSIAMPRCRLG